MDRRLFIKILFSSLFTPFFSFSNEYNKKKAILKKIPKSEEYITSIGMGTWLTFDIGYNTKKLKQRAEILKVFFNLGPKNDWRFILDERNRKKIEESFKEEMQELGYLKL